MKFSKKEVGSSISCSGVCLTLENFKKNMIKFYVSKETLSKSNFKVTKRGDIINLEKELSEITGLGVNIDFDSLKKTGTIKLQCKNLAEFNFIIKKIKT